MRSKDKRKKIILSVLLCMVMALSLAACGSEDISDDSSASLNTANVSTDENGDFEVPDYEGEPYVEVNDNEPEFDEEMLTTESYEDYGSLDRQGRCTTAIASLSVETQPEGGEERGDISSVHPSGWKSGQGWERCHLIGWQLSAENDNARNLVTGTHYMNVSGMLPFENEVDWYIEETGNHVLYEVTPIFEGKNSICDGVHMQAESVEDNGKGISFNVFCFNVSPGKSIDYKTGEVETDDEEVASENTYSRVYIINTNTGKFHYPSCSSVSDMAENNKKKTTSSRDELINQGYSPCGNCQP